MLRIFVGSGRMLMNTFPSPFAIFTMMGEVTEEGTILAVVARNEVEISKHLLDEDVEN